MGFEHLPPRLQRQVVEKNKLWKPLMDSIGTDDYPRGVRAVAELMDAEAALCRAASGKGPAPKGKRRRRGKRG